MERRKPMSNIVEIIKVIEANLNTLNERIITLELNMNEIRKEVRSLREILTDDGK